VSGITAAGCTVNARHIDANTAGGTVNVVLLAVEGLG
jgi:predicted thioesterase